MNNVILSNDNEEIVINDNNSNINNKIIMKWPIILMILMIKWK